ncbi:hypothetical protein ERJ75_000120400 [Trypanosoma vivax]|uniref:Uncharacterized protein n=1 Tax=Trypanosoma vivax (strain Y486) TaxID=1055687 RepID=F9WP91_TRYVY|nr:hypothetical protein ERJ75_000120400 [Trypanosoma vivax]CCD19366.1 hypothetical protein, conserved in T. vivax [Trypanosoma vivax Y486]|eukprot:CCD19366.1 hypothetical protein, conserved in T. vivax [Trypanosoma vivax Y486]
MWLQFFFVLLLSLSARRGALGTASGVAVNCTNNGEKWTCDGEATNCENSGLREIIANNTAGKTNCERATCSNECEACNCTRWTRHSKTLGKAEWTVTSYTVTQRNDITNLFNGSCPLMSCPFALVKDNIKTVKGVVGCPCPEMGSLDTEKLAIISSYFPEGCSSARCAKEKNKNDQTNNTVTMKCTCHQSVKTVGTAIRPTQTTGAPKEEAEVKVEAEKPSRENVKPHQEQDTPKHTHTPVVSPSEEVKKMNLPPQSNDNPNKSDTTLRQPAVGLALLFFMEAAQTQL